MARIMRILRQHKEINTVHAAVKCTYTSFQDATGVRYFQLDTYGRPERDHPEKVSQSLQFDASMARELIELIKRELRI